MQLKVKKLYADVSDLFLAYGDSVGFDVAAYLKSESGRPTKRLIPQRETVLIPTGLQMEPPRGHSILVCSRSGMAKKSIFVTNAPGVIDPGYRGEISVLLYNGSAEPFYVSDGDRIAQLLVVPLPIVYPHYVPALSVSERGDRGFGSSGGFANGQT